MDVMQKVFSDKKYCLRQLGIARETFGSRKTTLQNFDNLEQALTLLYLYCPDEIKDLALATLEETISRRVMLEILREGK
jgi:hypothetical protein